MYTVFLATFRIGKIFKGGRYPCTFVHYYYLLLLYLLFKDIYLLFSNVQVMYKSLYITVHNLPGAKKHVGIEIEGLNDREKVD